MGHCKYIVAAIGFCFTMVGCAGANENSTASIGQTESALQSNMEDEAEAASLSLVVGQQINLSGVGRCRVAQANGVELHKSNLSRNDCIAKCASYEGTNPGRICTHTSGYLRVSPRQVCQVVGAAGVVHYYALSGRMRCSQECNKYGNPNRQCLWGGVSVKP